MFLCMVAVTGVFGAEPPVDSKDLATVDIDGNGFNELVYHMSVLRERRGATVASSCIPANSGCLLLAKSSLDAFFYGGDEISSVNPVYVNPLDGLNRLPLGGYVAQQDDTTLTWYFFSIGGTIGAGERTDVVVGLRVRLEESDHYGWVRFTRPDALPETLFAVAGHEWNPVPGAPIRAGLPPEIPVASEILPGGAGIRLTWPGGISHWILESTASLSPPITWEEYPASGGSYADVPTEDADRFFRLRRPD